MHLSFSLLESCAHTWVARFCFPTKGFPLTTLMAEILVLLLLRLSTFTQKLHCPYYLPVLKNNSENEWNFKSKINKALKTPSLFVKFKREGAPGSPRSACYGGPARTGVSREICCIFFFPQKEERHRRQGRGSDKHQIATTCSFKKVP